MSAGYVEVYFNESHYFGPDGPWQAVRIDVAYRDEAFQSVNVYPTFLWEREGLVVPSEKACQGYTSGDCALGSGISSIPPLGVLDPAIEYFRSPEANYSFTYSGSYTRMRVKVGDQYTNLTGAKVGVMDEALYHYPNGVELPTEVGFASLGGESHNAVLHDPLSLCRTAEANGNI